MSQTLAATILCLCLHICPGVPGTGVRVFLGAFLSFVRCRDYVDMTEISNTWPLCGTKRESLTTVGVESLVEVVSEPWGLAQAVVVVEHALGAAHVRAQAIYLECGRERM